MELTSKQRAQLRGLATNLDTIVHVGKDGIGDNLIKQVNDALEARELIKGRVLENSHATPPARRRRSWQWPPAARWCRSSAASSCSTAMQHDKGKRKIELVKDRKSSV